MKLLGLDHDAPWTLRAAAILALAGSLCYAGFFLADLRHQPLHVVFLAQIVPMAFILPRGIMRMERWAYWLNAVLIAPLAVVILGFLVFAETRGWMSGTGLIQAYRAFLWGIALCFAGASILCLLPPSKRAADAARTLNGLPITQQ